MRVRCWITGNLILTLTGRFSIFSMYAYEFSSVQLDDIVHGYYFIYDLILSKLEMSILM